MTPRPLRYRRIGFRPGVNFFKPAGVPLAGIEEVCLTYPELEALRLFELEEKTQEECAKQMSVSQPTFSRILNSARKKIADALVNGKAIRVEGGKYEFTPGRRWRRGW